MTFKSLLKEPVLHFLLIGLLLFVAYGWLAHRLTSPARASSSRSRWSTAMALEYRTRWSRPPTEQELAALVDAYVRDEILYREGVALGLDRDDPVIKRRVRQKLEVIAEEQLARDAATDADLAAYLARHAARSSRPGTVSFEQIYFAADDTGRAGAGGARRPRSAAATRRGSGSRRCCRARAQNAPLDLVARDFGREFAARTREAAARTRGPARCAPPSASTWCA